MSQPPRRPRVVITGAGGRIGRVAVAGLAERWEIRATDLVSGAGIEALDVTDADACRAAFTGSDAIVHLAGNPDETSGWDGLREPNVVGPYVVCAAAQACSVPRLVLASSQQAVSAPDSTHQRRATDPPRPANVYGATKAWTEALGSWVAASSATSVVALRIGHFLPEPPTGDDATPRNLAAWLSPGDAVRLIQAAVEARCDGFTIVNGISANRYRHAEIGTPEAAIGYHPQDDPWTWPERSARPGT